MVSQLGKEMIYIKTVVLSECELRDWKSVDIHNVSEAWHCGLIFADYLLIAILLSSVCIVSLHL